MRALELTENEILRAERNDKYAEEQQFQMLKTWLDKGGREVTLKALLGTLCVLDLQGVESRVREALVSEGLYIYQE